MKLPLCSLAAALLAVSVAPARAQTTGNLIPNWNFSDPANPLKTFRIDYPYQGSYVNNASYFKISPTVRDGGVPAIEGTLPVGVAENQGGKVETALVKIEPGASYHMSVDVMTNELAAKVYTEVYAIDPTSSPIGGSIDRIPASDGLPALVKCYRAGSDDPPQNTKAWVTVKRDFTVPAQVVILGKPAPPVYACVKAWGMATVVGGHGTIYFSKFVLTKTKPAPPSPSSHGALP